jgi:hypothetical protein
MNINMLVYGDPGVGKTVFAASADNAVLFDCEGGTLSIQDRIKAKKVIVKDVLRFQDLEDGLRTLREKPHQQVKTIIIDSITEVQKKLNDMLISTYPDPKRPYGDGLMLQDWGYNTERMRRLVRTARDMDYNLIITALAMGIKDDSSGVVTTMPKLSEKLAADVCAYVDIVGYMFVEEVDGAPVRKMLLQPMGHYFAKDRSGHLPIVIDNPTFNAIHKMALNEK